MNGGVGGKAGYDFVVRLQYPYCDGDIRAIRAQKVGLRYGRDGFNISVVTPAVKAGTTDSGILPLFNLVYLCLLYTSRCV